MTSGRRLERIPRWILPFALALAGYGTLACWSHAPGRLPLAIWWGAQALGWVSCAGFLRTAAGRWPSFRWIVWTALAFRVCGLWAPPTLEDDYQRYLWDGWRTLQDGSPYTTAPADFFSVAETRPPGVEIALHEINNPDLPTIYAPVTEALFAASALIAPGSLFALKFLLLLIDLGMLFLLRAWAGRPAAWFYGWCPLAVTETAFHAHPEAWALLWLIGAWVCAKRERWLAAGALAGVAVGAKIFALIAIPFLAWRRPVIVLASMLGVVGLIYGPIVASGSFAEWSGLRAMAGSFEFNSFGYALLSRLSGAPLAHRLWLIAFGLAASILLLRWVWRERTFAQAPLADVYLAFFLLSPVLNPWYLLWLLPFLGATPTARGIALLVVAPLSYATGLNLGDATLNPYAQPAWVRPVEFGFFLLVATASLWLRTPLSGSRRL